MKVAALSALPLLSALTWTAALAADPGPFAAGSILLVSIGLLATATVGMIGTTLTGGPWARRLSFGSVVGTAIVAGTRPIDIWWWVGFGVMLLAAAATLSPAISGALRRFPPASGPPPRALLIPLVLLAFPFFLGISAWDRANAASLVVGASAPIAAFWFSRVLPAGLLTVRVIWPGIALAFGFAQAFAPGVVSFAGGAAVAVLAWHPSVKMSFHPPREPGTVVPVPPELTPGEVLDAADVDEKGRPRR